MPLLILLIIASRPGIVTNVFHIIVIDVEQNIFQVWNIPDSVHPILSTCFFSNMIRICFKAEI